MPVIKTYEINSAEMAVNLITLRAVRLIVRWYTTAAVLSRSPSGLLNSHAAQFGIMRENTLALLEIYRFTIFLLTFYFASYN